jgi:hypothetical protein
LGTGGFGFIRNAATFWFENDVTTFGKTRPLPSPLRLKLTLATFSRFSCQTNVDAANGFSFGQTNDRRPSRAAEELAAIAFPINSTRPLS